MVPLGALVGLVAACGDDPMLLDLRTDYRPGLELVSRDPHERAKNLMRHIQRIEGV